MNACRSCWLICVLIGSLPIGLLNHPTVQAQDAKSTNKEVRTWKAKDGGFSTEAALLEKKGESVVLERKDGKVITVLLDKLSFDDRVYVSDFVKKSAAALSTPVPPKPVPMVSVPESPPVPAPQPMPMPPVEFNLEATLKSWNEPVEPLQLSSLVTLQLERKPDLIEFSANGEVLYVVFYKEARHLLYGAKDGKLLQTIEYGTAPLTAAAITSDGKRLVATLGEKGTGVYDVAAKKEVFVHATIKHCNVLQTTSGKNPFLLATLPSGEFFRARLQENLGVAMPRSMKAPAVAGPDKRTEIVSSADGNYLMLTRPFERNSIDVAEFTDEGRKKQHYTLALTGEARGPLALGNRIGMYLVGDEAFFSHSPRPDLCRYTRYSLPSGTKPQFFVSSDDSHAAIYEPERGRLSVHLVASNSFCHQYQFYSKVKPEFIRMNWGSELLAACDAAGRVEMFRLRGYRHEYEKVLADVRACLDSKQDERLEKLAAAVEQDLKFFAGGSPADTKYDVLHSLLRNEGKLYHPNGINPSWQGWKERNPDSRLARYTRLEKLVKEAWDARGNGFAAMVTPEGWKIFGEKLAEAEPIIDSFAKEPTIPHAVYPKIFAVAMGQQWDEAKVKSFVDRMLKECPENTEGHAAYAISLLPRWGGKVDDAKNYAERVGKEFPGAIGEATYSAIVLSLHFYHLYGVFEELHFDRQRAMAGVTQLYRDHLNSRHHRQTALIISSLARNGPEERRWYNEVVRHNDAWAAGVMKESIFDDLMSQLGR